MKIIFNDPRARDDMLPRRRTQGSAGLDLHACCDAAVFLSSGDTHLFPTGVSIYIEDPHIAGLVIPRSGLGHKHGIVLGNTVGLIDSDYQGPLMVSLRNTGKDRYIVMPGDRIAQLILIPVMEVEFEEILEFTPTQRGDKGYGSTGK